MKIINTIFILLFLVAAFLQLNDPDPIIWFGLYLMGAVICGLAIFGKIYRGWLWLALAIYGSYAFYLFIAPDGVLDWYVDHEAENIAQSMKAKKPWIEATREFFGLLLLSFAVVLNLIFEKKPQLNSKIISSTK